MSFTALQSTAKNKVSFSFVLLWFVCFTNNAAYYIICCDARYLRVEHACMNVTLLPLTPTPQLSIFHGPHLYMSACLLLLYVNFQYEAILCCNFNAV